MSFLINYRNNDGQCENGEDGILQKIFDLIGKKCKFCVEFGAGDGIKYSITYPFRQRGSESLLMDGCVIMDEFFDGRPLDRRAATSASVIKEEIINSKADVKLEFITKENINDLFIKYNVPKDLNLLVIDIDGNDYWIWKELDYYPDVVMIEFNQWIDPNLNVVIKYQNDFKTKIKDRYTSASCKAMYNLGIEKGYTLVEIIADNMIFVKNELAHLVTIGKEYQNNWQILYKNAGIKANYNYKDWGEWVSLD